MGILTDNFFKNRGIVTQETQEKFLNPNFEDDLHDPFDFVDMDKAVERIKKAIDSKEKILIYTDYDCDGIPAGTILHDLFKKIIDSKNKKNKEESVEGSFDIIFENYIPHRHKEGYGLHLEAIERYTSNGFTLMITADLGITNIREVAFAEENGMNVILTDHHLPLYVKNSKDELIEDTPKSFALINCQLKREKYVNKGICGAATAWKLVNAFLVKHGEFYGVQKGWEKWLLDMVALATVADMMPLTGENRTLVHYGLYVLKKSPRVGLQKLLSLAKENQKDITEKTLSFTVAPRVNAASRLDHPLKAFYMLSGANKTIAETVECAVELESINKLRKDTVNDISKYLNGNLEEYDKDNIVFIGSDDWPIGVAGLIATKIVEMTGKTSFVWGLDDQGVVRGSSRSGKDGVSVMDLTASIKDKLIHFGGHEMAGGFAFLDGKQDEIRIVLNKNYNELFLSNVTQETQIEKKKEIVFDFEYSGESLSSLYKEQEKLSPFGIANLAPIFKMTGDFSLREFGENKKHIELANKGVSIIKWNADNNIKDKIKSSKIFYCNLEKDNWKNGYRFMLVDCE